MPGFVGEGALALPLFGHVFEIAPNDLDATGERAETLLAGKLRSPRDYAINADPGAEKREG